jgi:hypothetical protein
VLIRDRHDEKKILSEMLAIIMIFELSMFL